MSDSDTAEAATAEETPEAPAPTLYGCVVGDSYGQTVVFAARDQYLDAVKAMADDGFSMCVDVTAVDYLEVPDRALPDGIAAERFEVVVNLLDLAGRNQTGGRRLRVRVQVPGAEPEVPTLFDLYPGCEALEREVYDMFGIVFTGHPDLTRILMPEEWEGYPLRKDYDVGAIPVQFKDTGAR